MTKCSVVWQAKRIVAKEAKQARQYPPRAILSTRMTRMIVGLIGNSEFISSRTMPTIESKMINKSNWFHLLITRIAVKCALKNDHFWKTNMTPRNKSSAGYWLRKKFCYSAIIQWKLFSFVLLIKNSLIIFLFPFGTSFETIPPPPPPTSLPLSWKSKKGATYHAHLANLWCCVCEAFLASDLF